MPDMPPTAPQGPAPEPDPAAAAVTEPALAREARLRRRRLDAAAALPVLGAVLFLTPLADVFAGAARVAGLPLGAVYIFGAWLGLVVATARLARGLAAQDGDG